MNIRQAAIQLEQAARAYGARTPEGAYRVPLAAQRPVYLVGPPGVGKTAVVAQVAAKLGIGYAACTMTHHTRQSALGLPLIARKPLGGADRAVTEYTMSEIVAEVWQKAGEGAETGILFLDEINCVSESLMPAILQLLQYKTFGAHALPRGWMIACAGNPPKYNRYAHTFDAVVMDRLRVIEVEPDIAAWRAFAVGHGVHPAIRSYLALRDGDFYVPDGDRIVTARSWTDLSDVMLALEAEGIAPEEGLFRQYLQVDEVAERFTLYFRLCAGIGGRLDEALEGGATVSLDGLPFDEAVFAALLLAHRLEARAGEQERVAREAERLSYFVDGVAREAGTAGKGVEALCQEQLDRRKRALAVRVNAGIADENARAREEALLDRLRRMIGGIHGLEDGEALDRLRAEAEEALRVARAGEARLQADFGHGLDFAAASFRDPNVLLILLNDLRGHGAAGALLRGPFRPRFEALWSACDPEARLRRHEDQGM